MENKVVKRVLANGLTVMVHRMTTIPKVAIQLWYDVGSKDEKTSERGIAHLIEHMIFKGTMSLSESDINDITHKLSGTTNAFTSYDYTGYLFDFPSQNWTAALPIMADCMRNCTFKEDLLTSEMKAVIQELKMYRDSYGSLLIEKMITNIFPDHPYHHPIIGYKQDLWHITRDAMLKFYKRHYIPNNAFLIIVGDVNPDEAFELAQTCFGNIPADSTYQRETYYHNKDLVSTTVTMYRDIQQPIILMAFVVPGARDQQDYVIDVLAWLLGSGKGSRLFRKLVDELELATDVDAFDYDLFDYGLLFIEIEPKRAEDIDILIGYVHQEIASIIKDGLTEKELERACKKTEADYITLLESNQKQAYLIGKFYLCTKDENYLFKYIEQDLLKVEKEVMNILTTYCRPTAAHTGYLLPLPPEEKKTAHALQELSDQEDAKILNKKVRNTHVEPALVAPTIHPNKPKPFNYPKHSRFLLPNGLEVLFYDHQLVPNIEIALEFKAKHYYDPVELPGLANFVYALLEEGTKNYSGEQLAQEIEGYGMTLSTSPGYIALSLLTPDLKHGLQIINELVTNAIFDPRAIEKIRHALLAEIKNYWDTPTEFSNEIIREYIYKNHPYGRSKIGTLESISKITREDLVDFYHRYITPQGSRISIVGDLNDYFLDVLTNETLGNWQGPVVEDLVYPPLPPVQFAEISYPINRDQVVLAFAGLSVSRASEDYDKLLLFDQIFTGGILGSMSSKLFQLREQSGLFYTIGGSMLANADEQPGLIFIKTIVSVDRLQEAEEAIRKTIETVVDSITQEEFDEARNAIENSMVDNFETNRQMAFTFLVLERFGLPVNYFDTRAQEFEKISLDQVKATVKKYLNPEKLVTLRVGRVK